MINEYELILQRKLNDLEFKGEVYIYPFGKLGKVVAKLLDQKEIPYIPLDSFLEDVSRLENIDLNPGDILLLASNNIDFYTQIRMDVSKRFTRGVIDLFEEDSETYLKIREKETQMQKCDCIYQLDNYRVKMHLPLYESDYIQKWIFIHGAYFDEPNLIWLREKWYKQLKEKYQGGGIALDIGSNIGNHALFMAKEMGFKKIIAFEPIASTYNILKKNIMINACREIIFPINKAVGQRMAKGEIACFNPSNIGGTSIQYADKGFEIVSIDDVNIKEKIDFVKIDVEGFEVEVIKGALKTLKMNKPEIYIEICTEKNLTAINELLPEYQYTQLTEQDYFFYSTEAN